MELRLRVGRYFYASGNASILLRSTAFWRIGFKPQKKENKAVQGSDRKSSNNTTGIVLNKFQSIDYLLIVIFVISALIFIINDPLSKIGGIDLLNFTIAGMTDSLFFALLAAITFIVLLIVRIPRYTKIERDRMIAFTIFCLFTVFFWAAFEQAAGSLPIYTRDFTDRILEGSAANIFKAVDLIVTIVPLVIITYVLWSLFRQTFAKIGFSNIVLGFSFLIVWAIVIFNLYRIQFFQH